MKKKNKTKYRSLSLLFFAFFFCYCVCGSCASWPNSEFAFSRSSWNLLIAIFARFCTLISELRLLVLDRTVDALDDADDEERIGSSLCCCPRATIPFQYCLKSLLIPSSIDLLRRVICVTSLFSFAFVADNSFTSLVSPTILAYSSCTSMFFSLTSLFKIEIWAPC